MLVESDIISYYLPTCVMHACTCRVSILEYEKIPEEISQVLSSSMTDAALYSLTLLKNN